MLLTCSKYEFPFLSVFALGFYVSVCIYILRPLYLCICALVRVCSQAQCCLFGSVARAWLRDIAVTVSKNQTRNSMSGEIAEAQRLCVCVNQLLDLTEAYEGIESLAPRIIVVPSKSLVLICRAIMTRQPRSRPSQGGVFQWNKRDNKEGHK